MNGFTLQISPKRSGCAELDGASCLHPLSPSLPLPPFSLPTFNPFAPLINPNPINLNKTHPQSTRDFKIGEGGFTRTNTSTYQEQLSNKVSLGLVRYSGLGMNSCDDERRKGKRGKRETG